jgi:hypothetical protein
LQSSDGFLERILQAYREADITEQQGAMKRESQSQGGMR